MTPNIYHAVVFDLHQKLKEFLDDLDKTGQIDRDETNTPYIISVDLVGPSVYRCVFLRNGKPENFVIHTRRKTSAICSWNNKDGFVRRERNIEPSRKERDKRLYAYESIMEQILLTR
jgi:hypothetical protein